MSGRAAVKINGRVNENLYYGSIFNSAKKDDNFYQNPLVPEGAVTVNEEKLLSAGDEYVFSLQPTEVIMINIKSLDGNDVEFIAGEGRKETRHTVRGGNVLGMTIGFQNR